MRCGRQQAHIWHFVGRQVADWKCVEAFGCGGCKCIGASDVSSYKSLLSVKMAIIYTRLTVQIIILIESNEDINSTGVLVTCAGMGSRTAGRFLLPLRIRPLLDRYIFVCTAHIKPEETWSIETSNPICVCTDRDRPLAWAMCIVGSPMRCCDVCLIGHIRAFQSVRWSIPLWDANCVRGCRTLPPEAIGHIRAATIINKIVGRSTTVYLWPCSSLWALLNIGFPQLSFISNKADR